MVNQSGLYLSFVGNFKITLLAFACTVVIELWWHFYCTSRLIEAVVALGDFIFSQDHCGNAPLVIIWIQNNHFGIGDLCHVVAVFPILNNTTLGLRSVNKGLLNLFQINKLVAGKS